ncbi:MAG: 3-methyl-2-oxobutanoate hydroxymethyltransferase [Gammaproteobacteria bacterium]|nr:3-methyl-2-oxobutanoate hydroxymethyltransferase [Gammaproteobacteria bacterium]
MSRISLTTLRQMKQKGEKIATLTAYDASFARLIEEAGVEVLLVGDSLGMVVQGQSSTIPVSLDEMVYHTAMVSRGSRRALIIADLPFLSYASPEQALARASRLMKEGGAQMVKLEGGAVMLDTVRQLAALGVPVCAHLGLLPQSVHKLGGYRIQGRESRDAEVMLADARAMEQAGADLLVLECVPRALAAQISETVSMPVIGIGAGPSTDGQVLVLYDMLGITPGKRPKFSHDFLAETGRIDKALAAYVEQVKSGHFPAEEHGFD